MTASDPVIVRFERVGLAFGGHPVLRDVSFVVRRGETKVLLGESGSGKTLVMKLTLGLLRPDAGRIFVLDEEINRLPEEVLFALRRRMGMTFQESALFDSLSVRENVAYRLSQERQLSEAEIEQRVRTCLRFVDLEEAIDRMPADLSGGMRHRVSIARALATEPELMLYDSPTGGLDPETAATIIELIIKLRDVNHVTALLASHRLQDGYRLATQVWDPAANRVRAAVARQTSFLLLRAGAVAFDGGAEDLIRNPDPYLREFLA